MDISKHIIDTKKSEGVWIPFPFSDDGDGEKPAEFLIAYAGTSKKYKKALTAKSGRHSAAMIRANPDLAETIAREAMADGVLLDWKGLRNGADPLPCTRENKLKVLGIPEMQEWIWNQANDAALFRTEARAEDAADLKSGDPVDTGVGSGN